MNKPIIIKLVLGLCLFFPVTKILAQSPKTDSSSVADTGRIIAYFNAAVGQSSGIYNGREYQAYETFIKGTANFHDLPNSVPGTVTFNGYQYKNVPLLYDIYRDELTAMLYNGFTRYVLQNGRVASFDLDGHHFIYIVADTVKEEGFKSGYYDQLYRGKIQVLARHVKTLQNSSSNPANLETYFTPTKTSYLVMKGVSYYPVSSEGSLLGVLKEHKSELQQFIKSNNIRYKKNPEQALKSIAAYYDHLNP